MHKYVVIFVASLSFWLQVFLHGVGCSEGYSGVNVFEYFGNLLCFVSKVSESNPFILLVNIFFSVILVR
jgi:hypothetical protein